MKFLQFPLLTDENINPAVVQFLRQQQFDVCDVAESGLGGIGDADLLRLASAQGRVIVTHDSDFGTLAIFQGEPVVGIVYVRPGHMDPHFTISTLRTLFETSLEIQPPFLIVARRRGQSVSIRVRQLMAND